MIKFKETQKEDQEQQIQEKNNCRKNTFFSTFGQYTYVVKKK